MTTIKIIGFDLDQTLYPKSPEIDETIQAYIYTRIAAHKGCSIEEARALFYTHHPTLSGRKTLEKLGIPNATDVVQEALERADIAKFLHPNPNVIHLLRDLRSRYGSLSLITGSDKSIAEKKLHSLQIPSTLFDFVVYGNVSKSTGEAYQEWLSHFQKRDPKLTPGNFLYVGDRYSSDVEVPEKLGIQCWLVNNEKQKYPHTKTFDKLLDIRDELLN